MAEIKVDTIKLKECGKDIMILTKNLEEVMTNLYERISKMPTVTKEWTGGSAQQFVSNLNTEKKYYMALKNNIYKYGKILYDTSETIDQINKELN